MTNEEIFRKDAPVISRLEIEGRNILRRIHEHDEDSGGILAEITGMPGSGKTSVMLGFVNYTIKFHKNEKIFWSNAFDTPMQFMKLGEEKWKVLIEEGSNVTFHDRIDGGKEIDFPFEYFKDFEDLYRKAPSGVCNAVFFKDRLRWMDFIEFIRSKHGWHHVYIDEFGEICPANQQGKIWKKIDYFCIHVIGQIRKCCMNVIYNTQSIADIDYRARRKLMCKVFLPGAKRDGVTRVTQRAIDGLRRDPIHGNYAYLDAMGVFGAVQFSEIYKPIPGLSIEARRDSMLGYEVEKVGGSEQDVE